MSDFAKRHGEMLDLVIGFRVELTNYQFRGDCDYSRLIELFEMLDDIVYQFNIENESTDCDNCWLRRLYTLNNVLGDNVFIRSDNVEQFIDMMTLVHGTIENPRQRINNPRQS